MIGKVINGPAEGEEWLIAQRFIDSGIIYYYTPTSKYSYKVTLLNGYCELTFIELL